MPLIDPVMQACYRHMALQMSLFSNVCIALCGTVSSLSAYAVYDITHPRMLIYKHYKGDEYALLGVVPDATDAREGNTSVIYQSLKTGHTYTRDLNEFSSAAPSGVGRFDLIGKRRVLRNLNLN
jgi:hypothetical protein